MAKKIIEAAYPSFNRSVLDSGIRVVTESIPSVRSISVGVWIFSGSRDESPQHGGISHFIEHMVFKGTGRRRMHHIAQRMEAVGGYLNAFTSKEYTCFYARALDEHLERAIDTVTDLIIDPSFPAREIEKEKDVVIEEMKMYEDNPEDLIFDRFESIIYGDHHLGRPILGQAETVAAFSRDDLLAYVDEHYTPNRIVLAVAGNVRHDEVVRLATKAFASLERPSTAGGRVPVDGYTPRQVVERRPTQQAHVVLGVRGLDIHHDDRMVLTVLNTLLGGGMSSRLNQNIREKYGYCYNVYSFLNMHSDAGEFGVYMGTDRTRIDRAQKLIARELEKVAAAPLSRRMLNQAKNQVKGSIMLGLESLSNRMMRIGRQELYFERYFTLDEIIDTVDAVSEEDVRRLAQTLFVSDEYSTVVFLPNDGPAHLQ